MYYRTAYTLTVLMRIILWTIEVFLVTRVILLLASVSTAVPIAAFVYRSSAILLLPFRGLFPTESSQIGRLLEFSTLLAMVVYGLVIFLCLELIHWAGRRGRQVAAPPPPPTPKPQMSYYDEPSATTRVPRPVPKPKK